MVKKETLAKLKSIAEKLWQEGGIEYANIRNFETYSYHVAQKLNLHISPNTIRLHSPRIKSYMRELEFDSKLTQKPDVVVEEIDLPTKMIIYYKSGKTKTISLLEQTPVANEPVLWTGLFDYNDNKIIVRRGKYTGADVRNKTSILSKWGSYLNFYNWCQARIDDVENKSITIMPDTEKDVNTLKAILKRMDNLMV